jgi:competence protein ComEC
MFSRKKISILIVLIIIAIFYYHYEDQSPYLRVGFLDVGQGDAVLIKTPKGKNILIDGGPSANFIHQLGREHSYQNHHIDILILTHAHADHFYGLIEVVKRYNIQMIFWCGVGSDWSEYKYFQNLIEKLNSKIALLGQEYLIEPNLKIKILYPTHILTKEEAKDVNNTSVSLILSYKQIDFWLAGDLTCEGEDEILKQNLNLKSEIYKVSHHGSRWSNCDPILDKVKPELAIIQSGLDNQHKHPHLETLERLEQRSIPILRNDELGDIWIYSDGEKCWLPSIK